MSYAQDLLALCLGTANLATEWMPQTSRHAVARAASRLTRALASPKWRAVESNLSVISAWCGVQVSPDQVFENFAVTLSDFLSQAPLALRVEGRQNAEAARARGKGIIFLTSHLGHWELGGRILSSWGWPATAVYQPYGSLRMQKFIQKRRAPELRYLAVGRGAAFGVARALRKREAVAFLGDRPFGEAGSPVSLCGRPARLPRGPFLFACQHGTPIIPGFVVREKPGCYVGYVEEALWPDGSSPEAVENLLQATARVLEKYISKYPDQWYCFEPVW